MRAVEPRRLVSIVMQQREGGDFQMKIKVNVKAGLAGKGR
jgi:hypothetical protein